MTNKPKQEDTKAEKREKVRRNQSKMKVSGAALKNQKIFRTGKIPRVANA